MVVEISSKDNFDRNLRPENNFKQEFVDIRFDRGTFDTYITIRFYKRGIYWYCCIWGRSYSSSDRSKDKFTALNKALQGSGITVSVEDRDFFEITSDNEIEQLVCIIGLKMGNGNYHCHHSHA